MAATASSDIIQGSLLAAVGAARESAEQRLIAATDGQPLCAVGHGRVDARKYAEGRWAALAEAERAVAASPDPHAAIVEVQQRWVAKVLMNPDAGAAWAAYWAGGVDAVTNVVGGSR